MIRDAQRQDVPKILDLIRELADYEKLTVELELSEHALARHLFGEPRLCEALVACQGEEHVVGYALVFASYTTFKTRACLFLEDLYVQPASRGQGFGRALLSAVAELAERRGCARMQWNVLDWNTPAIEFYEALGAEVLPDWRVCQLSGEALAGLARGAR